MSAAEAALSPGILFGLWDIMIKYDVRLLVLLMRKVEDFENDLSVGGPLNAHLHSELSGNLSPMDAVADALGQLTPSRAPNERLSNNGRKWLWALLGPFQTHIKPLGLVAADIEIQHIWNNSHVWTARDLAGRLKEFRLKLIGELNTRFFLYLTPEEAEVFQMEDPFGADVSQLFRGQKFTDLVEASKCMALGRYTACVFHLMRVMEFAVQKFGQKLGINLTKVNPGRRVSELTWEQILNEINPKLKAMPQDTLQRKRRHEKYKSVQSYLYGVKDAWRNPTMHPRLGGYNELEARNIMNHVRSFLVEFATLLKQR